MVEIYLIFKKPSLFDRIFLRSGDFKASSHVFYCFRHCKMLTNVYKLWQKIFWWHQNYFNKNK